MTKYYNASSEWMITDISHYKSFCKKHEPESFWQLKDSSVELQNGRRVARLWQMWIVCVVRLQDKPDKLGGYDQHPAFQAPRRWHSLSTDICNASSAVFPKAETEKCDIFANHYKTTKYTATCTAVQMCNSMTYAVNIRYNTQREREHVSSSSLFFHLLPIM